MRALYKELRLRRKHARIIGVGLSIGLLLLAAFVFIALESLPSTNELRTAYFSSRLHKPISATATAATVSSTTTSVETSAISNARPAGKNLSSAPGPKPTSTPLPPPSERTLADYVTDRFIDRGDRSLNVCRSLANLPQQPAPFDIATLDQAMRSEISGPQTNPFTESLLAPLATLLQIPNVASVVSQIRDAQDSQDTSLLRRAQFYSTVALAASDVYNNKNLIDRVSDHAYHLSVISRIAATIPGAGSDPALQDLCTAVEARALAPLTVTAQDEANERAILLQLIGAMGLTPQQAGFDPNLSTQISVQLTPTQVSLASPWMDLLYGSRLQLSVQR